MATSLRKTAANWFTRIFLFILVISFAVWGVADFLGNTAEAPLAKVAGASISAPEFNADFRRELFRLQQQYGPEFTSEKAREMGFDREVLRQMLVGVMFDKETEKLSLTTSDETIAQSIRENASFRDTLGQFDRNIFQSTLNNNGFTEKEYLRRARQELTRRQLIAAISAGVTVPKKLSGTLYSQREEQRIAELLFIPQTAIGKLPAPTDAALEAFHKSNEALFTAPETRAVSYIRLRPEDLANTITPTETELREQYDTKLAEFTVTGMRNLQQFVLPDEAAAKAAREKIKTAEDFVKIAKQTAGMSEKELELMEVTKEMLPAEISAAVFALKEREISTPLQSPLGWHLVRITAARQERVQPFEEVRSKISRDLQFSRAIDLLVERANQIEDARAGGASLEEAAKEFSLPLNMIAGIDRDGNGPDGKLVAAVPADPQFIADIFTTDAGAEGDLRESKEGGYFILRVDSITEAAVRPLATIRADVVEAWRASQTGEKLNELADGMLKSANAGKSLTDIAKALTLKPTTSPAFGRGHADDLMSAALTAKLFTAKAGDSFAEPAPKGGFVLARLKKIQAPDHSQNSDAITKLERDLSRNLSEDLLAQYQSVLERRYEVSINQNRLSSLFDEQ